MFPSLGGLNMALSDYHLSDEIEEIDGLWFPAGIKKTAPAHALNHSNNADIAASFCRQRRYCIQAGGNVGIWPLRFAASFEHVFTFEPEEVSMRCLARNIAGVKNIAAYSRALGPQADEGFVGVKRESLGSHYLVGASLLEETGASNWTQMNSIDQFCADGEVFRDDMPIDLIQLDIEGFEIYALRGAVETLKRCKPVLCLEVRSFPGRFAEGKDELKAFLLEAGYRTAIELPGNDVIFKHKDS